jgi:Antibiotic biosynthesis monooxygenase
MDRGCGGDEATTGFISTQLHRGIGGSRVFLNYAVWESSEHFERAFGHPEFRSHLVHYPASTRVSPRLFQKLAMPGICVSSPTVWVCRRFPTDHAAWVAALRIGETRR